MPEQNHQNALAFENLSPFQQGCVDCILDCEGNGDHAAEWQGVGREEFSQDVLRRIVADCDLFIKTASSGDPDFATKLFGEADEYDAGWYFHLERQGTGVGFAELHIGQPLLSRLQMSAGLLGEVDIRIGDDGKARVGVGMPKSFPTT